MPFTVIRKALTESLISEVLDMRFQSGMLQFTRDNILWEDLAALGSQFTSVVAETLAPGSPATATLDDGILTFGIPAGGQGADGIPGAPGTNGADGLPIELFVDGGFIKWRLQGEAGGIPLIALADLRGADGECLCDDDAPQNPANSAQTRCGVAVAIVAELKTIYTRWKLDPDGWDAVQVASNTLALGGGAASAASSIGVVLFGAGAIVSGVGIFGTIIGGVGVIASAVLGLTNDNSDEFTPTRQTTLEQALYCVLTRRETVSITIDALREFASYVIDAGFPDVDRELLLSALAWTPIQYWRNEALVAAPKINPCSVATCDDRNTDFVYQFSGTPAVDHMRFKDATAAIMMDVLTGIRDGDGIRAIAAPLNYRTFNVRVHLGNIVSIQGIEIEVAYNQTRDAISPVTLTAEGISETLLISGISESLQQLNWSGSASIREFTISGLVATTGDFDEEAYLDFFRLKICGDGWPAFGISQIGGMPCELPPDDIWCREFDFSLGAQGWTIPDTGSVGQMGVGGIREALNNSQGYRAASARRVFSEAYVTEIRMEYDMARGTATDLNGNPVGIGARLGAGTELTNFANGFTGTGQVSILNPNAIINTVRVHACCGNLPSSGNPGGTSLIKRVTIRGTGANPFGDDNCIP